MTRTELKKLESEGSLRTFSVLQDYVATSYGIQAYEIKVKSRRRVVSEPRQVVMFLGYMFLSLTCKQTGRELGGYNHSTVIHGSRKVCQLYKYNKCFRLRLNELAGKVGLTNQLLTELLSLTKRSMG